MVLYLSVSFLLLQVYNGADEKYKCGINYIFNKCNTNIIKTYSMICLFFLNDRLGMQTPPPPKKSKRILTKTKKLPKKFIFFFFL